MEDIRWIEIEYKECISQFHLTDDKMMRLSTLAFTINSAAMGAIFVFIPHYDIDSSNTLIYVISILLIFSNLNINKAAKIINDTKDLCIQRMASIESYISRKYHRDDDYEINLYTEVSELLNSHKARYTDMPMIVLIFIWLFVLLGHSLQHVRTLLD